MTTSATDVRYVIGDATDPVGDGPKVIAHIVNNHGLWGAGFVIALSRRWKKPEQWYRKAWNNAKAVPTPEGERPNWPGIHPELGETTSTRTELPLGMVQIVPIHEGELWVANMVGQHGVRRSRGRGPAPIRYEAVEECLGSLAQMARACGASVHMPRIGCGLAGGEWAQIEPLIRSTLCAAGVTVTVYDLPVQRG